MTKEQMSEKIRKIVADIGGWEVEKVQPETTADEMDLDLLDRVEIIMALEEEFNLSITDEEAEKFNAVSDIIGYVENHQSGTDTAPATE